MPGRPDIDRLCGHIASYARREPWPSLRREHLVKLLGPIPQAYGLDADRVFDEVHRLGHLASMIGFLDESFLSSEHGPERLNPIDDYLRRRGWQETPRAREYLQGIRNTPPTLLEVQDVASGEWVEVRGTAHMEGDTLVVETNSRTRMENALVELHAALGPLVMASPTSYEDPMRAVLERAGRPRRAVERSEKAPSPKEAVALAEVVKRAKDAHYRRTLGEPIPMLGNKSPRQCRRSKQGRALLLNWLKELENQELRQATENGSTPYDMRWIWQELGVERER